MYGKVPILEEKNFRISTGQLPKHVGLPREGSRPLPDVPIVYNNIPEFEGNDDLPPPPPEFDSENNSCPEFDVLNKMKTINIVPRGFKSNSNGNIPNSTGMSLEQINSYVTSQIALLRGAFQEQIKTTDAIKKENEMLRHKVGELEARIRLLENRTK